MSYEQFFYWLDGFISGITSISSYDLEIIKEKMKKVTDNSEDKSFLIDFLKKRNEDNVTTTIKVVPSNPIPKSDDDDNGIHKIVM